MSLLAQLGRRTILASPSRAAPAARAWISGSSAVNAADAAAAASGATAKGGSGEL